jgi:hypothetical protein
VGTLAGGYTLTGDTGIDYTLCKGRVFPAHPKDVDKLKRVGPCKVVW